MNKSKKPYKVRLIGLSIVVTLVFCILGFNLWCLQVQNGTYYTEKAKGNSLQIISLPATRGDIIDTKGKPLATSRPEFDLTLDYTIDMKQTKEMLKVLVPYIQPFWPYPEQTQEKITEDILVLIQNKKLDGYKPIVILSNINDELRAIISEHQNQLSGISVTLNSHRFYPEKTLAGQPLGYVREISKEEIPILNKYPDALAAGFLYQQGDIIGKMGVERSYDYWLRGVEGKEQVEVDSSSRPIEKKILQDPEVGKTVQLTLDADLQKVVQDKLDEVITDIKKEHPRAEAGSAVIIDVNTGKILAMASRPYMDPNDLIGTISQETSDKYFTNKAAASFNRVISGVYPPGSTFKMVTAMGGLTLNVTTPQEMIYDSMSSLGPAQIQSQGFPEWGGHNFGNVNLSRAIALSSDIYFEVIGNRIFQKDPEELKRIASQFGLGEYSGIDLPGESKGVVPSAQWKHDYFLPLEEKKYNEALSRIDAEYTLKFASADDKTKKQLERAKEAEKKEQLNLFNQRKAINVDWRPSDSFNNAIGQGLNSYTPLQLANYVATMVNGGIRYQPYIVDKIIDPINGTVVKQNQPKVLDKVDISPQILDEVKRGMGSVTSGEGTAAFLFRDIPQFTGGGKTGTAQLGNANTEEGENFNGVFVAFAPYDHPQIAFAGIVDYGNHGSETAGYVAKSAFMKYFGWTTNP